VTASAFDRLTAPTGYGAVTPNRLGQLLAENVRLTRELEEARAHNRVLADDLAEVRRLAENHDRGYLTAYSNGA
jgi:hypothetical protein